MVRISSGLDRLLRHGNKYSGTEIQGFENACIYKSSWYTSHADLESQLLDP